MASCASSSGDSGELGIGAAILLVGVEKERIQPAVEIVVVSDIAQRARTRIELMQPPEQIPHSPQGNGPTRHRYPSLPEQQRQHIGDRALLDDEIAVHVGFTQAQLGVQQYRPLGLRRGEANRDRRTAAVAKGIPFAACCGYSERAVADKPPQKNRKQPIHTRLPSTWVAQPKFGRKSSPQPP